MPKRATHPQRGYLQRKILLQRSGIRELENWLVCIREPYIMSSGEPVTKKSRSLPCVLYIITVIVCFQVDDEGGSEGEENNENA
uniref:Uncharacterized protein n=1 Tax=Heterorhabditis bacteriophora TaxID=37862 RepID=A0A1I7XSI9_HETBA